MAEGGRVRGEFGCEGERYSPVFMTEVSVWKVAFWDWVKRLVRAREDSSQASGGW